MIQENRKGIWKNILTNSTYFSKISVISFYRKHTDLRLSLESRFDSFKKLGYIQKLRPNLEKSHFTKVVQN